MHVEHCDVVALRFVRTSFATSSPPPSLDAVVSPPQLVNHLMSLRFLIRAPRGRPSSTVLLLRACHLARLALLIVDSVVISLSRVVALPAGLRIHTIYDSFEVFIKD